MVETIDRLKRILYVIKNKNNEKCVCIYKNKKIKLSYRQLECIALMLQGYTYKQIGTALKIGPRTVSDHLDVIKDKFNCMTKSHLAEVLLWGNVIIGRSKDHAYLT